MSKSQRLRVSDISAMHRLLGECEELWDDPDAWQGHLLEGACRLTGAWRGVYVEDAGFSPSGRPSPVRMALHAWTDERAQRVLREYAEAGGPRLQPDFPALARTYETAGRVTARQRDNVPDEVWYRSQMYQRYARPMQIDDHLVSVRPVPGAGTACVLSTHRAVGEPGHGLRERRLLELLHDELAPRIGTRLATWRHRCRAGLNPRPRQVLDRLLAGDSEKQVAARLGISQATVHEHVMGLYRHFGVQSRSELLAYFVHRRPQSRK